MQQSISYRKVRDLSAVFAAAFGFIKINFKTFFGSLFLFAGPFLLIYTTIATLTLQSLMSLVTMRNFGSTSFAGLALAYFVALIFMFIGISVYNVILNKNVIENEKLLPDQRLTLKLVMSDFFSSYGRMVGNMILFALSSIVIFVVLIFLIAGLFTLSFGISGFLGAFLVFVMVALMFIFVPVLSYIPTAALFVCQRDSIGIFAAIGKVIKYLRKNFWNTWVVSFISLLTYSLLVMIAQIPVMIVNFITGFSRLNSTIGYGAAEQSTPLLLVIVTAFCTLLSFGVMGIYYLMSIYQYGNLEEKHEGAGVLEKIKTL